MIVIPFHLLNHTSKTVSSAKKDKQQNHKLPSIFQHSLFSGIRINKLHMNDFPVDIQPIHGFDLPPIYLNREKSLIVQ